jgi:hypothetical protein
VRAGAGRGRDVEDDIDGPTRARFLLEWFKRRPTDSVAAIIAAIATITIVVNALFLQSGPHPAPIFANKPHPVADVKPGTIVPRPRPAEISARPEIVADIQRELAKRGFYDGAADGVYGPKTDAAIRDFEQTAGLRPSAQPNDVLLQTITRSTVRAKPAAAPSRSDPIASLLTPDRRVVAVQRALADFGYGQIRPSGFYDPETRAAIERFERERKLPVTGQVSDRLARELSAMTGRPLE